MLTNGLTQANGAPIRVWLAGQPVDGRVNAPYVEYRIPEGFAYRGFIPVQLEINGLRSNVAYLFLPDEGI